MIIKSNTAILPETAGVSAGTHSAVTGHRGLAARVMDIVKALMNRRQLLDLSAMDERMLKDIGVTRSDVVTALDEAWHRDPSQVLTARAREHRAITWRHIMQRHQVHAWDGENQSHSVKPAAPVAPLARTNPTARRAA